MVVVASDGEIGVATDGHATPGPGDGALQLTAVLPPLYPEWLGERGFCEAHRVRFPYVTGEMANGIATTAMVIAMARARMLGFFGAAGLGPERIANALDELEATLGDHHPWGVNLIHSPNDPELEEEVVEMFLRRRVVRASASAFMALTPAVVRYAASGLRLGPGGDIARTNHVFAKLSRPEVARHFLSPPPPDMVAALVARGRLTREEAELARHVPVAEDITVEADSGGHTDNQALTALFPAILRLRDQLSAQFGYRRPVRVGAAGGLGTPAAIAGAFALGAAYVLTGSVNQAAIESGLSDSGKAMLAGADIPDVVMAPSSDMFELGVKVQVLKRGTLFAARASKLYELYRSQASLETIPVAQRARLERDVFRANLDEIWAETQRFWRARKPAELERAERDPKHKMALVFRWYLGMGSRWANVGDGARQTDFQIWCGPAMGAFNRWVAGSFLAELSERSVVQIALNLLEGAATVTRAHQLRSYGAAVPASAFHFRPRPLSLGE